MKTRVDKRRMILDGSLRSPSAEFAKISSAYLEDETACIDRLLSEAELEPEQRQHAAETAQRLVLQVRKRSRETAGLDAFLGQYDLSSEEGIVLMCLAEALLRIPDVQTANRLIHEKLTRANWSRHLGQSHSLFVNAATWGLMLTGRITRLDTGKVSDLGGYLGRLAARTGEPVIRRALKEAMRILGQQFVMGRTIEDALRRSRGAQYRNYRFSFDMLGEAALTATDAERYYQAYSHAVQVLADKVRRNTEVHDSPGISVKLSALHPRFELSQMDRVMGELVPRVKALVKQARDANVAVTLDAEEADRLEPTLIVFEAVFRDPAFEEWQGFGLAVQAYQKRASYVLDWLVALARNTGRRIMVRLVKGAYWDTEIKRAQESGFVGYPVFTRKLATDVSYLACAKRIFASSDLLYPQFATHNAYSVAAVLEMAGDKRDFEFQRLHGMGEALYNEVSQMGVPCRVYAPVGSHKELLPYLVRRLLENGANTSFVNRIIDEQAPVESLTRDPVATLRGISPKPHPRIPLPLSLYGGERRNSLGINLSDTAALQPLAAAMEEATGREWEAAPLLGGKSPAGQKKEVLCPADQAYSVGQVLDAEGAHVDEALELADAAATDWNKTPAAERAAILERAGDLMEKHRAELMALCVNEAGRCVPDALGEVRETVDYCRYYALRAREEFERPTMMPGPTGESNSLRWAGRGVFACISPWNFPLAIFTGQVVAALAAGNAVAAKPASQTPLIAMRAVQLLHDAGVPLDVLHLLPGGGATVGARLIADPRVSGVVFTGSTETAWAINQKLAARRGPIIPFIAETGGQNAMIVDSSALLEQFVADALRSAFNSAGQRCSALRVLFIQEEIAGRAIDMLLGAMAELRVGNPALLSTDVGPVIDARAAETLKQHCIRMGTLATTKYQVPLPAETACGSFVGPSVFEIDSLSRLEREVFGPILHVIRYSSRRLDEVIAAVNNTGYGLTLGIHTRVESTAEYIQQRVRAGNTYVNRNIIGSMVGVQPFGGEGLSGTGPKAGGPHYLHRFATERTLTVNTAAVGGNAALLSLQDDSD